MTLNPRQQEAVGFDGRALCVLAGAGSGKTRVLTQRVVHLVRERGARSEQILAVTFTNKAAREMRDRVARALGHGAALPWVSTFHSACARLLREFGGGIGLSPRFSIYDESESTTLIAGLLRGGTAAQAPGRGGAKGGKRQEARAIYRAIERARTRGQRAADMEVSDFDVPGRWARELLPAYEQALLRADAMDFAGLLLETLRLLQDDGDAARAIRARFVHLLVDEYQDTNTVQARLIFALARDAETVTVVGDDDQSIYAWRGACAGNMMQFVRRFDGAACVRLEQNYRSTSNILDAANAVISRNPDRLDKTLFTEQDRGPLLGLHECVDDRGEARAIVARIDELRGGGLALEGCAVLYRTNAQSRLIEEELRRRGFAYRVIGGVHFYGRREVKDLLAYLRLAVNPRSDVDFLRVLNVPARGIGETTRLRLLAAATERGVTLHQLAGDAVALAEAGLAKRAVLRVQAFGALIDSLVEDSAGLGADLAARRIADRCGLISALEHESASGGAGAAEAADRLDNIGAVLGATGDFVHEALAAERPSDLAAFLQEAALMTDGDEIDEDGATSQAVKLMTLHAAKGLEFDAVLISGLEDGLFPQARDGGLDDPERLAEERRLCYVGITRARRHLDLFCASRRRHFGELRLSRPSRFLADIPGELIARPRRVARPSAPGRLRRHRADPDATLFADPLVSLEQEFASSAAGLDMDFGADFVDDDGMADAPQSLVGAQVEHATFGRGVVTQAEGSGPRGRLVIRFADSTKRVIARYVTVISPGPA